MVHRYVFRRRHLDSNDEAHTDVRTNSQERETKAVEKPGLPCSVQTVDHRESTSEGQRLSFEQGVPGELETYNRVIHSCTLPIRRSRVGQPVGARHLTRAFSRAGMRLHSRRLL